MSFQDHFSEQAERYARYRPSYPPELFSYLAGLVPVHELAWDCGTGNGQAAVGLAEHFERVVATDASREQIENAFQHPRVEYRVEPAEATSLLQGEVNLISSGTAAHWFDFDPFYAEVRRVAAPRAVLAVWTYHLPEISESVDRVLKNYYAETLEEYWPERLRYLDERYRTLPFPFEELEPPQLSMETQWDLEQLVGFVLSWSGTENFIQDQGQRALEPTVESIESAWGAPDRARRVRWPLHIRIGRVASADSQSAGASL